MNSPSQVVLERDGAIGILRLNRPEARNAIGRHMIADLAECLSEIERDETVRVVVLCAAGATFCAGGDLAEMAEQSPVSVVAEQLEMSGTFDQLATLPVPVIAALHGHALGGGFLLSLYCDVRIASDDVRMGFPQLAKQWLPPLALSRLAAWIGPARAQQLLVARDLLDARTAHRIGLVDEIVNPDDVMKAALEQATRLSDSRREIVSAVRQFYAQLPGQNHRQWDQVAAEAFGRHLFTPESQAALQRFLKSR